MPLLSIRAYHHRNDTPLIFSDPVAHQLVSAEEEAFFANGRCERLKRLDQTLAASCPDRAAMLREFMHVSADAAEVLSRARYTEDHLLKAMNHGVRQYVLIGAGLDSYAFRQPDIGRSLRIIEIDRPAAQEFKRMRLEEVGLEPPGNLHFLSLDFTEESLDAALARSTYESHVPAFFSWLGSTQYLDHETVIGTASTIAQIAAPGSFLVFDYFDLNAYDPAVAAPRMTELITRLRSIEPLCCGFDPQALVADLTGLGFEVREHLDPMEIEARYFQGRGDGYHATEHAHFVCAVV